MKLTQLTEIKERPYICVHADKGKHETHATSSYDAAKNAAKHWDMKSTAGIDAHLAEGNYPEPRKMQVTQADKDNDTEAWKRFKAGDPRYEWKDMILSKREGDVSEATGEFAEPIWTLINDLGGDNDAHEIVLNDMVRYLGSDQIKDFVKDFRSNHDLNHPGEDGDYGDDDKNFESVKEATPGEAKPIYDLVGSLGAGDIELAKNPVFQDLVRFLDADTINKFVTDFRNNMDKDKDFKGSVDFGQYKESFNDEEYNDEERSQMEYTVWVGGTEVNDKWLNYEEAKELYDLWRAKGYDDVQLDARLKEGSFWGRDDMVAQMKRDELTSGMKKFIKIDDQGNHHGTTTSDPEEWEKLIANGYEEDKDYYKDIKEERVDELLPALAVGAMAAKAVGGLVGGAAKMVGNAVTGSVNASKKSKGKKKLNAVKEDDDDGMLRRQDGKYDPDEIRQMQYQQNVADPLNREIDASEKAVTIEVDYDLELDKPKSQNHLLKKHYKEMRKFNVFISMPEWQEGPKDSGFGAWTAKVRGSKKNLLGWLKAWEFDYDKEELTDMGLGESKITEEEEVYFNYEDIGGNIIVNPKSTITDQIGELLNRYYDISPMEFDPSKIEIQDIDESMNEDEEAIAARDEFIKVMDLKPKTKTPGPGKQIDTIKKIVADKQNMQVAFDDGKMRVDLYTASAVSQVYDAVKPETQVKIDNMLRTKAGMLKMSDFAFSKFNEGIKAGKRIDEILPALAVVGGLARAAVGKLAKTAIKHPIKTAAVVSTVNSDKPVKQKAADVARITSSKKYENLDELQAPYTGADAVIDKMGKKHKPGSPKANMIINMKKKAPVVAKPLQNKTANTSGVKPA